MTFKLNKWLVFKLWGRPKVFKINSRLKFKIFERNEYHKNVPVICPKLFILTKNLFYFNI